MPKRSRPVEIPVPPRLRAALMEIAAEDQGRTTSLRALVEEAQEALSKVNTVLASSPLADLVAKEVLRNGKRRGHGSVRVDARGVMTLFLGGAPPIDTEMPHTTAPGGSGLPSLKELRDLAELRGVDITDLGRRKRDIMARLNSAQYSAPEDPRKRLRDEVSMGTPIHDIKIPR